MKTELQPIGKTSDGEPVVGFELNEAGQITSIILRERSRNVFGHYPSPMFVDGSIAIDMAHPMNQVTLDQYFGDESLFDLAVTAVAVEPEVAAEWLVKIQDKARKVDDLWREQFMAEAAESLRFDKALIASLTDLQPHFKWDYRYTSAGKAYYAELSPHRYRLRFIVWRDDSKVADWRAAFQFNDQDIALAIGPTPPEALTRLFMRVRQIMGCLEVIIPQNPDPVLDALKQEAA